LSLFNELKRRNVLRVGAAYIVAAWLVIQVVETILPAFGFDSAAVRIVVIVLAVLLVPVLIFAWAFELTPEGLRRDYEVDRSRSITPQTSKRLDRLIMVVLALALGYFAFDKFVLDPVRDVDIAEAAHQEGRSESLIESFGDKSVAILPFKNRSAREDDAFFVDGIHDEILTELARIGSLRVISRTSVERFRDTSKSIGDIGELLDVKTILEGGVQRAGDRIRINVQLIDVDTDNHIWAENYEKEMTAGSIFRIQKEIATAVAKSLEATLTVQDEQQLSSVPTENLAALEAYFLGRQAMEKRTAASLDEAENLLTRAIELDPGFAIAYVELANTYGFQAFYSNRPPKQAWQLAEPLLDRALTIDERLGQAYIAKARFLGTNEDRAAVIEKAEFVESLYRKGLELAPGYASGYRWYSNLLSTLNRNEEALVQLEKALRQDPLSGIIRADLARALEQQGRFADARDHLESSVRINPDFAHGYFALARLQIYAFGRVDGAILQMRRAAALDSGNVWYPAELALYWHLVGDSQAADKWMARAYSVGPDSFYAQYFDLEIHLGRGLFDEALPLAKRVHSQWPFIAPALEILNVASLKDGDASTALARYGDAYPQLIGNTRPGLDRHSVDNAIRLAYYTILAGQDELGQKLLDYAEEVCDSLPAMGRDGALFHYGWIKTLRGQEQQALAELRRAVDTGVRRNWRGVFFFDPILEPLRDEPEFAEIVAILEADMAVQLRNVRAMEAAGDLVRFPD
jgi:TolB-like protein/Tfp pilus assembly protein PilF